MVTLRLHRIAVIFIVIGAVLLAVFIFVGGYLLGGRKETEGRLKPAATQPAATQSVATQPAVAPAPSQTFDVRVGMYDAEEEAKAQVQLLAARKFAASVVPLKTSSGITLYTVHVGPYPTRADAAAVADKLQGVVVPSAP
jgi:cell division septation protein DedD